MYMKTVINIITSITCKWGAGQHSATIVQWFKHRHKQSRPVQNWPEKSSGGRAVWCTKGTALSGCGPHSLQGTYPPSHTCQHTERITPSLPVNTQKESLHLYLSTHRKNHSILTCQHTERITPSYLLKHRKNHSILTCQHTERITLSYLSTQRNNSIYTC